MDADNAFNRTLARGQGGTVEPAGRAAVGNDPAQKPPAPTAERYELRDPYTEVTYRPKSLPEVVAKADQLGITRFTAVTEDGWRTPVHKVGSEWQRGPQRPPEPGHPLDRSSGPDAVQAKNVVPLPGAARAPSRPEPADAGTIARTDAQAERESRVAGLKAELMDRYVIKRAPVSIGDVTIGHTEYRFRGNTSRVAFTESTFRLATDTNNPSVARSMVDVAESRHWKALRVSGHEEFRQRVWFEASLRGVKTIGYEPMPSDLAWLRSEREARAVNRIEPARDAGTASSSPTEKSSARGGGGRKAVLAAIEAVLVARNVPEAKREKVMAAASEKLAQRVRDGQAPKVKVWDKAAPSQRSVTVPTPEVQRTRDRASPAPAR